MDLKRKMTILNFDNAYKHQHFYRKMPYDWIDFTTLSGADGYCDEEAVTIIRERLKKAEKTDVHYIDSGNYHYVTYLYLEQIHVPFMLVLFDHHTDLQPSMFAELLSCGSWVKRVLDENVYIQKVILIGAKEELIRQIPKEYQEKVISFSESSMDMEQSVELFSESGLLYPVYISIDKDVLDESEVKTNWDQGSLTVRQLKKIYEHICEKHKILGVDICGEIREFEQVSQSELAFEKNSEANEEILEMIEQESQYLFE